MAKQQKVINFTEETQVDLFDNNLIKDILDIGGATATRDYWEPVEFVHSGSLVLDQVLGGGFPLGRIMQIAGKQKSGKTSISLIVAGTLIAKGKRVLWVDMEKKFDKSYAERMGIYIDGPKRNMLLIRPLDVEDSMNIVKRALDKNALDFLVYDSIAGSNPKVEFNSDAQDNHMMKRAKLWAWFAPLLATKLEIRNAGAILLNQYVDSMDYERIYPGGRRKDHHCSIQLDLNKPDDIWFTDEGDKLSNQRNPNFKHYGKSGLIINGYVSKNHVGIEGRELTLEVRFHPHLLVNKAVEIPTLGREYGIFTKEDGSALNSAVGYHWYEGKNCGKGADVPAFLVEHKLVSEVTEAIRKSIEAGR